RRRRGAALVSGLGRRRQVDEERRQRQRACQDEDHEGDRDQVGYGGKGEAGKRWSPHECSRNQRSTPAMSAALAARAAAQPSSLTGPPNRQRSPRPVAATTTASVDVPL